MPLIRMSAYTHAAVDVTLCTINMRMEMKFVYFGNESSMTLHYDSPLTFRIPISVPFQFFSKLPHCVILYLVVYSAVQLPYQ